MSNEQWSELDKYISFETRWSEEIVTSFRMGSPAWRETGAASGEFPDAAISLRGNAGSFDCVRTSLCEVLTPLRMTGFWRIARLGRSFRGRGFGIRVSRQRTGRRRFR